MSKNSTTSYSFVGRPGKAVVVKGKRYSSLTKAAESLGVTPSTISGRINTQNPRYKGYRYAEGVKPTYMRTYLVNGIETSREHAAATLGLSTVGIQLRLEKRFNDYGQKTATMTSEYGDVVRVINNNVG